MRAGYRASQFVKAVAASPDPARIELAETILAAAQFRLFLQMQPSEVNHSLQMAEKLIESGETHPELLAAALLHDVGKSRLPIRLWERVAVVLVQQWLPGLYERWATSGELRGWKRIFAVAAQHPAWGAEMAAQAGASAMVVELVGRHQEVSRPCSREQLEAGECSQQEYFLYQLQHCDEES